MNITQKPVVNADHPNQTSPQPPPKNQSLKSMPSNQQQQSIIASVERPSTPAQQLQQQAALVQQSNVKGSNHANNKPGGSQKFKLRNNTDSPPPSSSPSSLPVSNDELAPNRVSANVNSGSNNITSRHIDLSSNKTSTSTASNAVISQLQQLQSPRTQFSDRESPITQVTQPTKSRHRGFLSHLLCCFRPSTSDVYHNNTNSIYNTSDVLKQQQQQQQQYQGRFLLPARKSGDNRICLVIDLDETLVHSSFKKIDNADFIVPVEIDGTLHKVYVLKRPHVDEFLKRIGKLYECVLFTASLAKYADPVADLLDTENIFKARLYRDSCDFYRGNYVKDLSRLGRQLKRVIIIDNSPASYIFHPENALPVSSYFDDETDKELLDLIPLLEKVATNSGSVVPINMC